MPGGTRTPNLMVRSHLLYPLSHGHILYAASLPSASRIMPYQAERQGYTDNFGMPGGTRTPNLMVRSHLLYPLSHGHITVCEPLTFGKVYIIILT